MTICMVQRKNYRNVLSEIYVWVIYNHLLLRSLADLDYTSTPFNVTISNSDDTNSRIINITIFDDSLVENTEETFIVTMSSRNLPENVQLEATEVIVTIRDNDGRLYVCQS